MSGFATLIRHHPSSRLDFPPAIRHKSRDVVKAELYYDGEAARIFGELRADLARKGTPIGPYDIQIAAIALA